MSGHALDRCWGHEDCRENVELSLACGEHKAPIWPAWLAVVVGHSEDECGLRSLDEAEGMGIFGRQRDAYRYPDNSNQPDDGLEELDAYGNGYGCGVGFYGQSDGNGDGDAIAELLQTPF